MIKDFVELINLNNLKEIIEEVGAEQPVKIVPLKELKKINTDLDSLILNYLYEAGLSNQGLVTLQDDNFTSKLKEKIEIFNILDKTKEKLAQVESKCIELTNNILNNELKDSLFDLTLRVNDVKYKTTISEQVDYSFINKEVDTYSNDISSIITQNKEAIQNKNKFLKAVSEHGYTNDIVLIKNSYICQDSIIQTGLECLRTSNNDSYMDLINKGVINSFEYTKLLPSLKIANLSIKTDAGVFDFDVTSKYIYNINGGKFNHDNRIIVIDNIKEFFIDLEDAIIESDIYEINLVKLNSIINNIKSKDIDLWNNLLNDCIFEKNKQKISFKVIK